MHVVHRRRTEVLRRLMQRACVGELARREEGLRDEHGGEARHDQQVEQMFHVHRARASGRGAPLLVNWRNYYRRMLTNCLRAAPLGHIPGLQGFKNFCLRADIRRDRRRYAGQSESGG